MSQQLTPTDVLVDGYVARTFAPEDANNYFMLLLRTPPFYYFLPYYGIVYHQGAWNITHNANVVQGTSPGVPLQTTPLLDHSIRTTQGTVLPQRRWTPADEVDVRRHVEGAALHLPTFFVNCNGSLVFRLSDILQGCDRDLHNANSFASLGGRTTTHIRINWPDYGYWKRQVAIRDETHARNQETFTSTVNRITIHSWLPISMTAARALAGVEIYLLFIVKNNNNFHTTHALLIATYCALFFFLSATLSGIIVTDKFGEFPAGASQEKDSVPCGDESNQSYQGVWVIRHCLVSLIAGTMSVIAQVLIYGWLAESVLVKGTLSVILAFAVLSLKQFTRLLWRN